MLKRKKTIWPYQFRAMNSIPFQLDAYWGIEHGRIGYPGGTLWRSWFQSQSGARDSSLTLSFTFLHYLYPFSARWMKSDFGQRIVNLLALVHCKLQYKLRSARLLPGSPPEEKEEEKICILQYTLVDIVFVTNTLYSIYLCTISQLMLPLLLASVWWLILQQTSAPPRRWDLLFQ